MSITENELSEREQEILCLVATGASNKEIAQRLSISANTVKVHLRNIFVKIGASSRTEAAMFAVNVGLVEKSPIIAGENLLSGNEPGNNEEQPIKADKVGFDIRRWRWIAGFLILPLFVVIGYLVVHNNQRLANTIGKNNSEWKQLALMPTARHNLAVVAYDGYIYAISGQSFSGLTGAVERYDLKNDQWVKAADKPIPVYEASAAVIGGKVYVPGGRLANGGVTDVLEIYDIEKDVWSQGARLPQAMSAYALVTFEGRLYLFGGWDGSRYLSSVFIYDPVKDDWSNGFPMPTPRAYLSAVVTGRKIFVIGGKDDRGSLNVNEVYAPDLAPAQKNSWKKGKPLPLESPTWKVVSLADLVYAYGEIHVDTTPSFVVMVYMSQNDDWQLISNQPDQPAKEAGLVGFGTSIYTIGGLKEGKLTSATWMQQVIFLVTIPFISR